MKKILMALLAILFFQYTYAQTEYEGQLKVDYFGISLQSFDHPFFKFKSSKYSSIPFTVTADYCGGLNYSLPYEEKSKLKFQFGLYYTTANMEQYWRSATGVGFRAQTHNLYIFSGGIGIEYDIKLFHRFFLELAAMPTLVSYHMPKDLTDTSWLNSHIRERRATDPWRPTDPVEQFDPAKLSNPVQFQLRNRVQLTYYTKRRLGYYVAAIYNFGLPFKTFEWSYTTYDRRDYSTPIASYKGVFSSSSLQVALGISIGLGKRQEYY